MNELKELTERHAVVVTPSLQVPGESSGSASFTAALIAVSAGGRNFLSDWAASTRRGAGLELHQRDDAGSRSEPFIIRERGWDIGFWNLGEQRLQRKNGGYTAGGAPFRFFRFRGYEPEKPHLLSRYMGESPSVLLSEDAVLTEICETYRQKLLQAGYSEARAKRPLLEFMPTGLKIDAHMRRIYREALARYHHGTGPEPPSPFGIGGERAFLQWINDPLPTADPTPITRYMMAIHSARTDVQAAFREPLAADAAAFSAWYQTFGRQELDIPSALLPRGASAIGVSSPAGPLVTVAGFFRAELGIGEAARLLVSALEAGGVPFQTVAYDGTISRQAHDFPERLQLDKASDTNIVCVNADQFPTFAERMGPDFSAGRYTVGVWFWEVDEFPDAFHAAFNYLDEIWVASDFVRRSLLKVSPKPVFKFDLPIAIPEVNSSLTRAELDIPRDSFCFLFSFDFLSVLERKNPRGLIEAFQRAFAPGEGPTLLLKTINGDQRVREMERLKFAARHRTDIKLIDGYLSAIDKNTMTALCDCYVSLHRSEGFGLTMAEAMALAKPVIATAYSANLEFMTRENSYLCSASERRVGADCEPYPPEAHWAEPNLNEAAALMREVYEQPAEARIRGDRAAEDIRSRHSAEAVAHIIRERIELTRRRRARGISSPALLALEDRIDSLERSHRELRRQLEGGETRHGLRGR
jgi:glycosyltransferase involved in cell wall biosynthesis